MLSKADIVTYLTLDKLIRKTVSDILQLKCNIEDGKHAGYKGDIQTIHIFGDSVDIMTLYTSGCDDIPNETYHYTFPVHYLFDSKMEWADELTKTIERKNAALEQEKQRIAEQERKETEKQERKELKRLMRKYKQS